MDHDVHITIGVVAHGDRLQDPLSPDARRQLLQAIGIECATWLLGIGLDPLQPDLLGSRQVLDTNGLGPMVGEQRVDGESTATFGWYRTALWDGGNARHGRSPPPLSLSHAGRALRATTRHPGTPRQLPIAACNEERWCARRPTRRLAPRGARRAATRIEGTPQSAPPTCRWRGEKSGGPSSAKTRAPAARGSAGARAKLSRTGGAGPSARADAVRWE